MTFLYKSTKLPRLFYYRISISLTYNNTRSREEILEGLVVFISWFHLLLQIYILFHQENVFTWSTVVLNTTGPPPSTEVLPMPLVHSWSSLIQGDPLRVIKGRTKWIMGDQDGPGGPGGPWCWVVDQEHCGPLFTFCWCCSLQQDLRNGIQRSLYYNIKLYTTTLRLLINQIRRNEIYRPTM